MSAEHKPTYSPEDLKNLMAYGYCRICRAPRSLQRTVEGQSGKTVYEIRLVCKNGHAQ